MRTTTIDEQRAKKRLQSYIRKAKAARRDGHAELAEHFDRMAQNCADAYGFTTNKEPVMAMTHVEALAAIKTLRDKINQHPMPADGSGDWVNRVLYHLDAASDVIEFPEPKDHPEKWS